ncbi:MAG: hypothetical protein Q9202_001763 [Teloschistes flavicans]
MHTACWTLLEACWDRKTVTTPVNLDILADFFISQPRGLQLPHMLEGNWVTSGLKFLTGDYTRYRDPDNYTEVEVALDLLIFPDSWPRFKRKNPSLLGCGKPDCFSLLPVEIRLMILCFLPTESVEAAREASGGLAFVPLEGTFWLSRLSEPEYCHLPRHLAQRKGDQEQPGDVPQWFLALQEDKMRNKNRLRIIGYNEMLIDKMIQRQLHLRRRTTPNVDHVTEARYVELITCPDEPHPAYQKAERTLTWTSEALFNSETPFSSVAALTPAFTGSYGGKYLSGLIFHTDQNHELVLGHRSPCLGCRIDISNLKSYTNKIILQADSRGIFEIRPQRDGPPIMQLRRHGKIVLDPTMMGGIFGLRAEPWALGIRTDQVICSTDLVDSPTVQWYGLQTLLEQARSDVLLLLDCCAAASSAAASGNGVTELIAACGFESWAPGVGEHSFSRSLIEELKYLSYGPPFSATLLHNRVLSRIKYWKPRFTSTFATERRKTPIYIQLANDLNRKSIQLGPLPLQGTGIDSGVYVQPTAQSSTGSTDSEDIEMLSPDSSQSSLAEVWPDPGFKCPKVLISIALEDNQQLDREDWTEWLRSVPALTKYMQIQGCYESDSTVILGLIPVAVWDLLPKHPAISFVSFVRSENLFKSTAPLTKYPSSVFKAADKFLRSLQRHGKSLRPSIIRDRLRIRVVLDEFIRLLERTTYSVDMLIEPNGGRMISSASRRLRSIYIAVDDLSNTNQKGNAESEALTLSRSEDMDKRLHSCPGMIQKEASTEGRIRSDSISAPPANVSSKSLTQSSIHDSIKVRLRYAVEKGDEALMASLFAAERAIEASKDNNMTALHHAIKENNIDVVRSLLDIGANIEACDGENKSPLHLAAKEGHTDMMSLLLTKGAGPEARDWYGKTPLHYAAKNNASSQMVVLLLTNGARVAVYEHWNRTPLHYAVEQNQASIVWALLEYGADADAFDADGMTPLDLALENLPSSEEAVSLLQKHSQRGPRAAKAAAKATAETGELGTNILY